MVRETLASLKRNSVLLTTSVSNKDHWPQYIAGLLVNLCSLSVGLHVGWTSPSLPTLLSEASHIKISVSDASWISSIQSIGDLIGAPLGGYLCQAIGRKKTILFTTIPHFISWVLIATATTSTELLAARFIAGIAEGACYICVPMYIGEIAEPEIRGIIGSAVSLIIIIGIFLVNVIGVLCSVTTTAIIFAAIPLITFVSFTQMPESPYFLILKNRMEAARDSLRWLRSFPDVEDEFKYISSNIEQQMASPASFIDIFAVRHNLKAFGIAGFTRFFQQMSGLMAITYFYLSIIINSGMSLPKVVCVGVFSLVQIASAILCTSLVDNYGRVPLLVFSAGSAAVSLFVTSLYFYIRDYWFVDVSGVNFIPFIGILAFAACFGVGFVSLPTLLISELFATNIKPKACVLTHFVFSLCVFVTSQLFMVVEKSFGMFAPFLYFGMMAAAGAVFSFFCVPETKGKTLEEIQQKLSQ